MPNTTNMSFLAWSRQYIKWRMRNYSRTRPQALADMRRSITHRDESWTFTRCTSCERPVVNNPELSGEGIFACQACGRCIDDCSCIWCARCGDECSDDNCGECSRCRSCCDCVRCDNCGEQTSDRCSGCGRGDCCECQCRDEDQPAQVRFFESPLRFWDSKLHERKLNPSPRYVAAEIEVASVKRGNTTSDVVKQWSGSIVHDGSLPGGGFEINTAPAGGDLFMRQISEICNSLNDKGARVTKECGLHVHINAKDFDYYALRRLVKAYAKIEDALYTMVSPSRRQSRYCIPCGAKYLETMGQGKVPKDVKIGVLKSVYTFKENCKYGGRDLQESKRHKYHDARYNALNIHSWFYRGTVECRMFNGSTNADKIQSWGMMWAHILDYVAGKSDKEVDADLANMTSVDALLRIVEASPARARLSAFVKERIAKLGSE